MSELCEQLMRTILCFFSSKLSSNQFAFFKTLRALTDAILQSRKTGLFICRQTVTQKLGEPSLPHFPCFSNFESRIALPSSATFVPSWHLGCSFFVQERRTIGIELISDSYVRLSSAESLSFAETFIAVRNTNCSWDDVKQRVIPFSLSCCKPRFTWKVKSADF